MNSFSVKYKTDEILSAYSPNLVLSWLKQIPFQKEKENQ